MPCGGDSVQVTGVEGDQSPGSVQDVDGGRAAGIGVPAPSWVISPS